MEDRLHRTRRIGARHFGTFVAAGIVATALFGFAGEVRAAGFALKEQSATALGNSFAGATAGAEDVSYMFFNPAGLTRHDGQQAAAVLSYIIPFSESKDAVGDISGFIPAGGESVTGDAADDALVPAVYGLWSVTPDLKLALGVNAPFGLTTEYSRTWQGRYHAVESSIATININPAIAYRFNENLSIGAGLQAQYFDTTLSNMVPSGGGDLFFEVEGDDWAYGFNIGAMYEFSDSTRLGLAYRSQIKQEIEGDATFLGNSTGARTKITTPDSASIGLYHDYSDAFAVMAEIGWTGWSSFDEVVINLDNNIGVGTTITLPEDWNDVWFFALGATWRPTEQWAIRGGVAYDQSPIPEYTRTPRLPGQNRTWVALGAQYVVSPNFTIDAGYTHIFFENADINVTNAIGNLQATFKGYIDIVTAQATIRF